MGIIAARFSYSTTLKTLIDMSPGDGILFPFAVPPGMGADRVIWSIVAIMGRQ